MRLNLQVWTVLGVLVCAFSASAQQIPEHKGTGNASFISAEGESLTKGKTFQISTKQGDWFGNIVAEDQEGIPDYVDLHFFANTANEVLVGTPWRWVFRAPPGQRLTVGVYKNAVHAFQPFVGGENIPEMLVDGNGRGCETLIGDFTITAISWDCIPPKTVEGKPSLHLTKFIARFVQHCDGDRTEPKLQGTISFTGPKNTNCADAGVPVDPGDGGSGTSDDGSSLQISLPTDFAVEPAVVANATTTTFPFTTATDGSFESEISLTATSDAQEHEDFRVELTRTTIPSPGTGESELRILTGPSTFPRTYQVTITATAGDRVSSTSMLVTVTCDPPVILGIDQPKHITAANGTQVTLEVKPNGSGPYFYQWYKGVPGMTRYPVLAANESKLIFTTRETATYWVRVSNACGSVDSNGATVTTTGTLAGPARRRGGKS